MSQSRSDSFSERAQEWERERESSLGVQLPMKTRFSAEKFPARRWLFSKGHYLLWSVAMLSRRCRVCHATWLVLGVWPRIKIVPFSSSPRSQPPSTASTLKSERKKQKGGRRKKTAEGRERKRKRKRKNERGAFSLRWVSCKQSSRHRLITDGDRSTPGDRLITPATSLRRFSTAIERGDGFLCSPAALCAGRGTGPPVENWRSSPRRAVKPRRRPSSSSRRFFRRYWSVLESTRDVFFSGQRFLRGRPRHWNATILRLPPVNISVVPLSPADFRLTPFNATGNSSRPPPPPPLPIVSPEGERFPNICPSESTRRRRRNIGGECWKSTRLLRDGFWSRNKRDNFRL